MIKPPDNFRIELYLTYMFTNVCYLSEIFFTVNRLDGSDSLKSTYMIGD